MKIDTLIDIVRIKREINVTRYGKNPNYRRLMYVLMTYKEMYEVKTISEIISMPERNWIRIPNAGRKSLNLFKELLTELEFWNFYDITSESPAPSWWKKA